MIGKRRAVSPEAEARYTADAALARQFPELFERAQAAEQDLRDAQVTRTAEPEMRRFAKQFDEALTAVMRAAFAAERAEIGPRGYDDRIYRRKAMATSRVKAWSQEAQRLLTLRESHRLTGIVRVPRAPGQPVERTASPAA